MLAAVAVAAKTMAATEVMWVVTHPCCFVRLARKGAPKIGLQRQSGVCQKGVFKTNQLITFNLGKPVEFKKILINLDYMWQ
jgi:hypothetical protein